MTKKSIETKKLTKFYGSFKAVDNISINVDEGDFFGFLGPNGAGKTTFMRMLTGRLRPSSGKAIVNGYSVTEETLRVKETIGVLEDEPKLYERLSVSEYLDFISDIYEISDGEKRKNRLIELVDLDSKRNSLIIDLSHGMRKKVGLIGELIHDPEILFLDEPFAGIDPVSSKAIKNTLTEMTKEGVTIFLSTHILEVAEKLCKNVAIIEEGEIIARGKVNNLRRKAELGEDSTLEDIFLKLLEESEEVRI